MIATDIDGDTATGRVDIDVSDDVPEASDYDGAAFDEGSGAHVIGDAATLLGIDGNADGLDGPLQDIVFTATTGFGGSLAINDAGELVYTSPANVASLDTVTESFTYTVTDNDGDTVTRTVTFDVRDTGVSEVQASDALVDEDSISGAGGNPGGPGDDAEVTTGTITYTLGADALASITLSIASTGLTTLDGTPVLTSWDAATNTLTGYAEGDTSDVVFTIALSDITATGATYTVVLQQPVQHPLQDDPSTNPDVELAFEDNLSLTVDVVVRDADGSEDASSFVVSIDDDTPVAGDDVSAEDVSEGGSTGGNVLGDDTAGADGYAGEGPIVQVRTLDGSTVDATPDGDGNYVVSTALGTLTLNQNGTYTYESNPNSTNSDTSDVFIYTIRDADGDEAEAQLSIGIDNVAGDVSDNDVLVNEAGLPDGSDADAPSEVDADGQITVLNATGPFTFSLVGGVFDDGGTPDASDDTYTINGTYGTIVLNASTGSYTYTLDTPFTDSVDENGTNTVLAAESFEYEVRDAANNLITDPLADNFIVVDIIDDIPTAADETLVSVAEDLVGTVGGNVMTNDTEGADGATVTALTVGVETVDVPQDGSTAELVTVNGTYTIDYLGNWTFDPNPGLDQSSGAIIADFSYTLTDTDGDFDTATQPIRITDGAGPEDPTPIILDVDDQNLADGSTPNAPETDAATLNFVEGSDPYASFVFGDTSGLLGGLTWTRVDDTTITGEDGGRLVVTLTLSVSGNDATVTATLNDNYLGHSSQGDELDVLGSVDVIATDIDGDQAVGGVLVRVSDDVPTLTANAPTADSLTVDDDDFSVDATADFSGLFVPDYNADGAGDVSGYTLGFTSTATGLVDTLTNTAVTLVEVGDTIEGQNGNGDTVFVISVDANGTVTFDQQRAVIHDDTSDHNDAEPVPAWAANLITLSATVTDGDGDTAGATANIGGAFQILDDGPSVSAVLATGASVIVDETDLTAAAGTIDLGVTYTQGSDSDVSGSPTLVGQSSGANVLDVTVDFGNDQDVNGGGLTYSLTVGNGGASGVSTTSGTAITLVAVSDTVVVGVVNGTTTAAFAIEIDPSTGELSVEQYLSLQHDDPTDPDEADSPVTLAAGSLNAVVTAQDGDGDTDQSGAVDISGVIAFEDDGPTVTVTGAIPQLLVDESFLGTDATAEFGDVFTFAYGADGEALGGGESFLLGISAEGADSGLVDTATGNSVYLFLEGGVVVGREGTDALDAVGGEAVFTLTVDADGTVELDQIRAVVHNDPDNANEGAFLASDDLITLTARATDGDGDRGSATIDIGRDLEFRDDNPSAGNPITVLLDDDALTGGNPGGTGDDANSANTSGTLSFSFGADGGSIAFATTGAPSGFQYVASGSNILIQQDQGSGFVTVVTVTLNPTTGAYTVTQNLPVLHADGNAENNQVFNLTYVVTDGDGDTGATNGTLVINVDDDTPIANDVNSTGTVDEDGLSGIAGGDGDVAGEATLAQGSVTALFTAGADAPLTFGVNTVTAEAYLLSLDLTSGGADLEYLVSGNSITASADGSPVFNFFLAGNGDWQFELFGPLDHDDTSTEDDITIDFGPVVQASDADNDTIDAIGSVLVTIDDDSPIAVAPVAADVTNGPAPVEGPFLLDADGTLANNYGGDGAGTVRFSAALDGADSGMTSSFQTITYVLDDGQTLRGVTGFGTLDETTIFTVTLDPGSATYSVDMDGSIDSTSDVSFSPLTNNFVGGNNSWAGFLPLNEDENTAIDNDSQDLLLTPAINGNDSSTINSTANTGGVGGGASVGSGETFRVDFVTDLRGDPADGAGNYNTPGNRDHNFDGHYTVNGASALLKSTSGSTVNIAAYDDADGNTVVGDGTLDTITGVAITWRGTEWTGPNGESLITSTGVYTINGRQFTVTFNNDGTVNVAGVEGDNGSSQIGTEIAVFTDDGFNSVEYTWAGGQTFQIGGFGASTLSTDPVTFELPVEVVDGDGDVSDTANLSITANTPVSNAATLDSKASMMDAPVNDNDSFGAFSTKHVASQDPRFEARGMEMATVAAMASGLFLPHIHADLSQAFANTASAGRGMVNFEYAPIASIEAFQLPDGFGMGIEGLVGTGADLGAQFSMANILDSGAGFHAPQGAFAGLVEDPMAGFVAEPGAQVQLSGGPSVFEGFGGGDAASAMEALLMLEAPAKPAEAATSQDAGMALGEAVADVAAEAQVDAIVDHFAAGDGLAIATTTTDGLLDSMLGSDMALYHAMGLPAQDQSDEAAALAAASA